MARGETMQNTARPRETAFARRLSLAPLPRPGFHLLHPCFNRSYREGVTSDFRLAFVASLRLHLQFASLRPLRFSTPPFFPLLPNSSFGRSSLFEFPRRSFRPNPQLVSSNYLRQFFIMRAMLPVARHTRNLASVRSAPCPPSPVSLRTILLSESHRLAVRPLLPGRNWNEIEKIMAIHGDSTTCSMSRGERRDG